MMADVPYAPRSAFTEPAAKSRGRACLIALTILHIAPVVSSVSRMGVREPLSGSGVGTVTERGLLRASRARSSQLSHPSCFLRSIKIVPSGASCRLSRGQPPPPEGAGPVASTRHVARLGRDRGRTPAPCSIGGTRGMVWLMSTHADAGRTRYGRLRTSVSTKCVQPRCRSSGSPAVGACGASRARWVGAVGAGSPAPRGVHSREARTVVHRVPDAPAENLTPDSPRRAGWASQVLASWVRPVSYSRVTASRRQALSPPSLARAQPAAALDCLEGM